MSVSRADPFNILEQPFFGVLKGKPKGNQQNHTSGTKKADIRSYVWQGDCPLPSFIYPGFEQLVQLRFPKQRRRPPQFGAKKPEVPQLAIVCLIKVEKSGCFKMMAVSQNLPFCILHRRATFFVSAVTHVVDIGDLPRIVPLCRWSTPNSHESCLSKMPKGPPRIGCGSKMDTQMEPWQMEKWTKTCGPLVL